MIIIIEFSEEMLKGCNGRAVGLARGEQFIQKFIRKARKDVTTYET
jgi:hypothetical protein